MQKRDFTKEMLNMMTSLIISAGIVVTSLMMMFIIFITTIMLIGIVFNNHSISGNNVTYTSKSKH
ncbi:hypothetical protein ASG24_07250 [Methylophilus sp. Leaf414]|jgi:hypothetical protein|nr:hypothetical protein ASG24_07250 [Methylophilus sp. Leaf414]KQT42436.1 hypothetical protein ASG34_06740 [Methylophilus sp. Leaf416]KQT56619.1 hypothetical protein ASG44_06715 [Methylophilus sp. Leaf459]